VGGVASLAERNPAQQSGVSRAWERRSDRWRQNLRCFVERVLPSGLVLRRSRESASFDEGHLHFLSSNKGLELDCRTLCRTPARRYLAICDISTLSS
jgi:hypothetical protein